MEAGKWGLRRFMRFGPYELTDGDVIIVQLSRGEVVRGVFRGVSGPFLVLSDDCGSDFSLVLNVKRITMIWRVGRCAQR